MSRLVRVAVILSAVAAMLGLAVAPAALAANHGVDISGFAFSPQSITVSVGDSVTWANADAQGHTATADDGSFDTGTITGSTPKSVTFSTAGTFAYHCKIHPAMTATVVVADAATAPPTDTAVTSAGASSPAPWIALVFLTTAGLLVAFRRFRRAA